MKKIFRKFITVLFGAVALSSCNLLNIEYDNALSVSNMWKDPSDLEQSVPTIYQRLRNFFSGAECNSFYFGEIRVGDSIWGPSLEYRVQDNFKIACRHNTLNASQTISWSGIYSAIDQANAVLDNSAQCNAQQDRIDWANGQAYFARAYAYFHVARVWGYAPLNLRSITSTDQPECYPDQVTPDLIYAQVLKDIEACEALASSLGSEKDFATKEALYMLKADYAMWMYSTQNGGESYLTMAEDALDKLNLGSNKLLADYSQVFSRTNEKNAEVIFSLCNTASETGGYQIYFCHASDKIASANRNSPVPISSTQWWSYPQSFVDELKAQAAKGDKRVATNLGYGPYSSEPDKHEITWCNKYLGDMSKTPVVHDTDLIYYRYGYALMLLAELKYYQRDYTASLAALNIVAKRAYGVDNYYTSSQPDALLDSIVKEYYYEFLSEGVIWWALIRTGRIWDIEPNSETPGVTFATMKETNPNILLWPIANSSLTKNHKLHQVKGWS